ncbi:hypothetical protein PybrP1_010673 [[Pythium] brassicae (nom. inval.)]|nr:hypothetical protein PybrP1_010673 [[Pythium] brassicae (nom. inval.)]
MDLFAGDVFGEEAVVDGCVGSNRPTTAVAAATTADGSGDESVELLYLMRQQYDAISLPQMQIGGGARAPWSGIDSMRHLLDAGNQVISARDRWRMAISYVIQSRAKRSRWQSVLLAAKRRRVDLVFDLLGGLPVFADTPKAQTLTLCASATLQTYAHDAVVFAKGEPTADRCFLVLAGEVVLQHVLSGAVLVGSAVAPQLGLVSGHESGVHKVVVHTANAGDVFGDFELFAGTAGRQISATVASSVAKVAILPREDFLQHWPRSTRLERKLSAVRSAFSGVLMLDPDHLCALYYAVQETTFKRGEAMSGSPSQRGVLHIIESGFAVIHDQVTLRKRANGRAEARRSPSRISVDTRLASKLVLAPSAVVGGTSPPLELARFLKDRELLDPENQLVRVAGRPMPAPAPNQPGPRAALSSGAPLASPKLHAPLGSFSSHLAGGTKVASPRSSEPSGSLPQLASTTQPCAPSSASSPLRLKDQLKREERVLEALSGPSSVSVAQRSTLESERQLRRRHGRPPPKIIENRGLFIDEHAFMAVTTLQQQHDRKKRGLCRRLLHLK